jgi:hypothetical protein
MEELFKPSFEFDEHRTYLNWCPYTEQWRWLIERDTSQCTRFLIVHLPKGYDIAQLEVDYDFMTTGFYGVSTSLMTTLKVGQYVKHPYEPINDMDHGVIAIAHVDHVGIPIETDSRTKDWFVNQLTKFVVTPE